MFSRRTQPTTADQYINWIAKRVERIEKIQSSTGLLPARAPMVMLERLQRRLDQLPLVSEIDQRDSVPRLWLDQQTWIEFDAGTEIYKCCAMKDGSVQLLFHSTREQAVRDWVQNGIAELGQPAANARSATGILSRILTPQSIVTALLLGMLAMALYLR